MSAEYQKDSTVPVFEMILNSVNHGTDSLVMARPSETLTQGDWQADHQEGQLTVDVVETEKEIVIIAPMAGADNQRVAVHIHNDLVTIRGERHSPLTAEEITSKFWTECFWGSFSRTIVLPVDVKADLARAEYKNGVLIVRVPKQRSQARIPVVIVED